MDNRYKIILSNNNLYKEIEIAPDAKKLKIGTDVDCDVRLRKDLFFGQIGLLLTKIENGWSITCSDNLYLTMGDVRKLMTKNLVHGDLLQVKYQESDNIVFSLEFLLDFDDGNTKYERVVDISNITAMSFGSESSFTFVMESEFVRGDAVYLNRQSDIFILEIAHSNYGVYINGKKAKSKDEIKNKDFLAISDFFFYFDGDQIYTQIRPDLHINMLRYVDKPNCNNYPKFNRNTRIKTVVCDDKIDILDPPAKPQKSKESLFMKLLPSLGMLLTAGVMAYMGGAMIVMSLISGAMAIITTVLGVVEEKKQYKKDSAERIEKYNLYTAKKRAEIENYRNQEVAELEELYVSQKVENERFETFSPNLFDRDPGDEDFLCVRLGNGAVVSKREIDYKKQERLEIEDDLQLIPEQICDQYKNLQNAPIVCDLKEINAMGIVGVAEYRFEFLKNMVIDIAARHYLSDVKMFFVAENDNKDKIFWLRLLPHAYNDNLGVRNIVCEDESKNIIFEYLYKELTIREQNKAYDVDLVVFFYDEYGFKNHPISKFIDNAAELGVTFVFFGNSFADIPQGCGYIVDIKDNGNAVLVKTENKREISPFTYSSIPNQQAERIVSLLAPVYTEEISLEGTLTKNITMFELLNILSVEDIDLKSRWAQSKVFKSMAAPLGVSKTGVVMLDLHDKAHGPHGLVAGTTGSGKSEILQTYILAMATLFHPYEVAFVIIDFKGGGMVNQFKELPHLLGAITNIDGKEIDRSLKSIKAELQKRQRLFAEADVNHIDKYIRKYKDGEIETPLPHLIIIVDEFAELKAEQPDFMKELISAARIGRSLGVHLILATQKPSGQVDDQIWSNSRFKLCLKVQSQEDSNEVLKSPLAAEIKEPGRAYLQVGNNEIFELFQSAYSGAPEKIDDSRVKEFSIYELAEAGKKKPIFVQKKSSVGEGATTQLDALVEYVAGYCEHERLNALSSICLPPLTDIIKWTGNTDSPVGVVDIGIYDDPDNQIQSGTKVDIANRNTLIIGSSQYGKTNLLQLIIKDISYRTSPAQSVFYILDFASMGLKNFEELNHVGGVVTSSEDEKLKNLVKLLFDEMSKRKEKLLSVGVSSYSSYLEAGYTDMPHIYLMVDNLTALNELYFQDDDSLLIIIREGISLGISAIMANAQLSGIGYRYISNFANKIALYCNDGNEYSNLFDHVTIQPDEKPGRCVLEMDKRMLECQTYLAFEGEKEFERVQHMHKFISDMNEKYGDIRARQIPCIPKLLTAADLYDEFGAVCEGYSIPIGLTYNEVKPYCLNLSQIGIFGITGKEGYGHKNFVSYIINSLTDKAANIVIFDDVSRKYSDFKERVDLYTLSTDMIADVLRDWNTKLEQRYDQMLMEETESEDVELLLMIIQNNDVAVKIQEDYDLLEIFNQIVSKYNNLGVCIILANYTNKSVSYDAPEPIRIIRQNQTVLCLDDLQNLKCFDPPYEAIRENKKPISLGDGYFIMENDVTKIKIVLVEQ